MNELSIARRYARALHEQAQAEISVGQLDEDVNLIHQTLDASPELRRLFESPVISGDKKRDVVRQLFGDRVQSVTLRFMNLLIEKNREDVFPAVVEAYRILRDVQQGVTEARVRVATPMSEAAKVEMQERLERMTGKKVRLVIAEDPDLLGGAIIRLGDTVYDGSVRNKLALLREQLERGQFSMN